MKRDWGITRRQVGLVPVITSIVRFSRYSIEAANGDETLAGISHRFSNEGPQLRRWIIRNSRSAALNWRIIVFPLCLTHKGRFRTIKTTILKGSKHEKTAIYRLHFSRHFINTLHDGIFH